MGGAIIRIIDSGPKVFDLPITRRNDLSVLRGFFPIYVMGSKRIYY
jgi:hypothetical protein